MRIAKETLYRTWRISALLAAMVFAVLGFLDARLKVLSGVGTVDLQAFVTAAQYDAAFHAWGMKAYLSRAGFNLGLDYLFMPLYGAAFFYSGVIVLEAFAPSGLLRRVLTLAALAPVITACLDGIENALQLVMLWGGPSDALARIAHTVAAAKLGGFWVGLFLLAGAIFVRVKARRSGRNLLA